MLTRPVRWALLLAVAAVAVWLRLLPLALDGLDPATQELYRYEDARGRTHVYLGDYDSYVWLRAARNVLRHGTTCDQVVDGVCRDTLAHAPVGRAQRYGGSLHVAAIVALHELITAVRPAHPLPASAYLVPVVVGALVIFPAFGIGRRLGGDVAGIAAAAALAWNPLFLTRTVGSDNDVWNVAMPLCLVWAVVRALEAATVARVLAWTCAAAVVVGLHAWSWSGWAIGYGVVLGALGAHLLVAFARALVGGASGTSASDSWRAVRRALAIVLVFWVGCLATTTLAGVEGYAAVPRELLHATVPTLLAEDEGDTTAQHASHGADTAAGGETSAAAVADRAVAAAPLAWPNVFAGVAELYRPRRADIMLALGGRVAEFTGWLGFVLLLLPWRGWRWWHAALVLLGGAVAAQLLFGPEVGRPARLAFLAAVPLGALVASVFVDRSGPESDVGAPLLTTTWFIVGVILAFIGARYVLLLLAPFALVFGAALGRLHRVLALVPRVGGWLARPAAVVALVLLLVPTVRMTHMLASQYRPRIDDAWAESLQAIRETSAPETILHLWWDYGYWAKYVAERPVTADGGSLRTRIPYWTSRSLLAADEREALGLLRMLSCGSAATPEPEGRASAYAVLVAHGVAPVQAHRLVLALAASSRAAAAALLAAHGLGADARAAVLAASHCTPPPALLVVDSMQAGVRSWKALARWLPEAPDASALPAWRRDFLAHGWIACTVGSDGVWQCPVGRRQRTSRLQHIALDPRRPDSTRLTLHSRRHRTGTTVVAPTLVVHAGAQTRTEMRVQSEPFADVAVLVDESGTRVLVGPHDLIRSTFVHLLFLDGRYARHFHEVDERRGVGGRRVVVWRLDWPGAAGNGA